MEWRVGTRLPHARYRRAAVLGVIVAIALASNAGAAPLEASAEGYRRYLIEDIGQALNGARTLRERLVASDLDGAKRAWIKARIGWERSDVFTGGLFPSSISRSTPGRTQAMVFTGSKSNCSAPIAPTSVKKPMR